MGEQSRSVTFRLSAVQWLGVRAAAVEADVSVSVWLRDVVAGRLAADGRGDAVVVAGPVRAPVVAVDRAAVDARKQQWLERQKRA